MWGPLHYMFYGSQNRSWRCHIGKSDPPLWSNWDLCIHKDVLKGVPFHYRWPIQVRNLTCFDAAPLMVFAVLGRWSMTSHLSWLKFEAVGGSCQGLSGKDIKIVWCSSCRALSFCNSFSCASTPSIAWSCICETVVTCTLWACSSSIICSTLCCLASSNQAISRASSTATHWCIRLSWWAWAW